MQVIGLTGSIASGKSTVLAICKELGAAVVDVDALVHQLLAEDQVAINSVAEQFPEALEDGAINRKILGEIVFADDDKLEKIEAILHPLAKNAMQTWIEQQQHAGYKYAVIEVPLLFETGWQNAFSAVMVAVANADTITIRAMARPGMTKEKLKSILACQWPQGKKRALADFVIDTKMSKAEIKQQLENYFAA